MQNRALLSMVLIWSAVAFADQPGDKRTILTSGEKVHRIGFSLGQSTVLYLGFKPETVICGNKNYFNIEKIKEGVTIQPLANFATNLSIMDKDRRYLFYLVPASGRNVDSFIDVKWVPASEVLSVERLSSTYSTKISEIKSRIRVTKTIDLTVLRQKAVYGSSRRIFEIELNNTSGETIKTEEIAVIAMLGKTAPRGQAVVWEDDEVRNKKKLLGRLIVPVTISKSFDLVVRYKGNDTRMKISGGFR
jgi:hypothetical protein